MGNVCCVGRINSSTSPPQSFNELPTITSMPSQLSPNSVKMQLEVSKDSSESQKFSKFDTVKFLSNKSSVIKTLDYSLIDAEDLSITEQKQVLQVLDQYKSFLDPQDQEMVDGFIQLSNPLPSMIMITTHALYHLNQSNFSQVHFRFPLEDLSLIILTWTLTSIFLLDKTLKSGKKIETNDLENLVKSIQQVSFEAFGNYVPWLVFENFDSIEFQIDKIRFKEILSDDSLAVYRVIVEHGEYFEVPVMVEKCMESGRNRMMNLIMVLTSISVFMQGSTFEYIEKVDINKISKVSYTSKILSIESSSQKLEFFISESLFIRIQSYLPNPQP